MATLIGTLLTAVAVPTSWAEEDAPEPAAGVAGTDAKPLPKRVPTYPASARENRQEGWVTLSYVVRTDGSVGDVIVLESSGVPEFEQAATDVVQTWYYEPATLGGVPTEQCMVDVMVPFSLKSGGWSARRASMKFKREYSLVIEKREEEDHTEATALTQELAARESRNLYEQASVEVLLSLVSRDQKDSRSELAHLERAQAADGAFLDQEAYDALLFRMFALQVELAKYADALATYEKLDARQGRKAIPDAVANIATRIEALRHGAGNFAVAARLGEAEAQLDGRGRYNQTLLRTMVGFSSDSMDALDEYELRCQYNRAKGKPKPDRAVRVPAEWGTCEIFVFGTPGSEFTLIEYADIPD